MSAKHRISPLAGEPVSTLKKAEGCEEWKKAGLKSLTVRDVANQRMASKLTDLKLDIIIQNEIIRIVKLPK